MWQQQDTEGNIDSFGKLKIFIELSKLQNTIIPHMNTRFSTLLKHFQKYFPMQDPNWILELFSFTPHEDFSTAEMEQFIDVNSDSAMGFSLNLKHWLHFELEW